MKLFSRRASEATPVLPSGHLFVIGAARTGTTVLQNALNSSADIFLLGEPDLHLQGDEPGFAARYNAMHRRWGNQETKSSYLPSLLRTDGGWRDHLDALAGLHRWVGSKVVINARRTPDWLVRLDTLHCGGFFSARYLFTFRDPLDAVASTRGLQALSGETQADVDTLIANYLDAMILFIRMLRTMPHVRAVFHEDVDADLFASLGRWLDTPLDRAATYYDRGQIASYDAPDIPPDRLEKMELTREIYRDLRTAAAESFPKLQIEQNDRHLRVDHFTRLGMVDRRARIVAAAIRAKTRP